MLGLRTSTKFPTDVDEENFTVGATEYPPPNVESMHGNIDYFVQRSKYAPFLFYRYKLTHRL